MSKKNETVIEPYYQMKAKDIIDSMFNNKVFNEKFTRDDMQGYEDLLAFMFHSENKMTIKACEFTSTLDHLK